MTAEAGADLESQVLASCNCKRPVAGTAMAARRRSIVKTD
jgi:hypothetical protein